MAISCPTCGDPLSVHGVCGSCGNGLKKGGKRQEYDPDAARRGDLAAIVRARSFALSPTSADLTEQQWYNVCKFWPNVAAHCDRPRPVVAPTHPLDAAARLGPLARRMAEVMRSCGDASADDERAAIQAEA